MFFLDNDVLCAFGTSHVVTMLLPLIFAHLGPVATSDPRVSFYILIFTQIVFKIKKSFFKDKYFKVK